MFVRRRTSETFFIGRPPRVRRETAHEEIARMLGTERGEQRLRAALAAVLPPGQAERMTPEEMTSVLAEGLVRGRFALIGYRPRPVWAPEQAGDVAGQAEDEAPEPEKSWLEITVLRKDTGAKVSGVPLLITPPGQGEAEHKTNGEGVVRLDKIPAGPCSVRCKLVDTTRADALVFLGSGGGGEPPAGAAEKEEKKAGAPVIVRVEKYKVRTGDTLESLAGAAGTTWQKLAKFNFGTDDPKKINRFLRTVVGCTRKEGQSYVFDDGDSPGIVLLPREWKAEGMETGHAYTVEVVPAAEARPWIFSL